MYANRVQYQLHLTELFCTIIIILFPQLLYYDYFWHAARFHVHYFAIESINFQKEFLLHICIFIQYKIFK